MSTDLGKRRISNLRAGGIHRDSGHRASIRRRPGRGRRHDSAAASAITWVSLDLPVYAPPGAYLEELIFSENTDDLDEDVLDSAVMLIIVLTPSGRNARRVSQTPIRRVIGHFQRNSIRGFDALGGRPSTSSAELMTLMAAGL